MKYYILPIICLWYISCQPKIYDEYSCEINGTYHGSYSDNYDYFEYKECVVKDSLILNQYVKENFQNCFCSNTIKNINKNYKTYRKNRQVAITIEPLYVDNDNCTGLYGQRVYYVNGLNPRYFDGFPHKLFLISQGEFINLTNLDTLEIKSILYEQDAHFSKVFPKETLDDIYYLAKRKTWWTFSIIRAPKMIIKNEEIIYDINKSSE